MDLKRARRSGFFRGAKTMWNRRNKPRAKSLDQTQTTRSLASSSHLSEEDYKDESSFILNDCGGGPSSKATSTLFRRRRGKPLPKIQDSTVGLSSSTDAATAQKTPQNDASESDLNLKGQVSQMSQGTSEHIGETSGVIVAQEEEEEEEKARELRARQDAKIKARRAAIRAQQKLYGESHPDVLFMLEHLAQELYLQGDHEEAYRVVDERNCLLRRNQEEDFSNASSSIPRDIIFVQGKP
jgi:hypothetical protein